MPGVTQGGREGRSSVARKEDCAVKTNKIEAEEERKVSFRGRIFLFGCSHGVACEAVAKQSCRCHWNCREAWLFLLQAATGEQQAIHPERAYSTEMPRAFQATVLYSSRQVLSSKPSPFTPLARPKTLGLVARTLTSDLSTCCDLFGSVLKSQSVEESILLQLCQQRSHLLEVRTFCLKDRSWKP